MRRQLAWVVILMATLSQISIAQEPDINLADLGLEALTLCDRDEASSVRGQGFAAVLGDSRTASWLPGFSGTTPAGGAGYAATHLAAIGDHRANLYHASHTLLEFDFSSAGHGPGHQVMGHIGLGSVGRAHSYAQ